MRETGFAVLLRKLSGAGCPFVIGGSLPPIYFLGLYMAIDQMPTSKPRQWAGTHA